jgi:hypothetical protein
MKYSVKCLHNGHLVEYTKQVNSLPNFDLVMKISENDYCDVWLSLKNFIDFLKTQNEPHSTIKTVKEHVKAQKITRIVYKNADFVDVVINHPSFFYEKTKEKHIYLARYHKELDLGAISEDFARKREVLDLELKKDADELLKKGLITEQEHKTIFS